MKMTNLLNTMNMNLRKKSSPELQILSHHVNHHMNKLPYDQGFSKLNIYHCV